MKAESLFNETDTGTQRSMIADVPEKEMRIQGKGKITQATMDDAVKLAEYTARNTATPSMTPAKTRTRRPKYKASDDDQRKLYELNEQIETLSNEIESNPARRLVKYLWRSGGWKGRLETVTVKQYQELTRRDPHPTSINKAGKVPWYMVVDQIAEDHGGGDDEDVKNRVEKIRDDMDKLQSLKADRAELKKKIKTTTTEGPKAEKSATVAGAPVFPKNETVKAEETEIAGHAILSRRNPSFHQVEVDDLSTEKKPDQAFRVRYKDQANKLVRAAITDVKEKATITPRRRATTPKAPRISPRMRKLK